ncbi:type II toxin-antitoxin system RelE/ParE family toxin [Chlorogloeopsis fritschii PCC 9212]|uniref:Uncharacterized protein n=1 Tax=Chlorogloeopsis fritschii PCC 6912 TaxID=211165 RepID=A0A433N410_CHLFR|nr:type II toxin-antitoxin system RelE/ParE family toxin [Chlorogloeopsis fritschii]RUR75989.1 hypothetical protein PCC6912_45610 [Chlorogloeopsis fritschii PCC 6912]
MRYVFHPEALNEYAEAVQYYTEQRVELAQAFINAIEDTVYRIRETPTRYAAIDIDKFEEHPRFSITRGDKKATDEFERTNKKLTNQILVRFFWVLFSLVVSSSVKSVVKYISW